MECVDLKIRIVLGKKNLHNQDINEMRESYCKITGLAARMTWKDKWDNWQAETLLDESVWETSPTVPGIFFQKILWEFEVTKLPYISKPKVC